MKILIARDEAFNFTYRANIDRLAEMGEVEFFSPLHDTPEAVERLTHELTTTVSSTPFAIAEEQAVASCLYLPGGYPELFAEALSANVAMRRAIKCFAEAGGRIFAECGGFMYLCRHIDGMPMCDVLPLEATMEGARLHLGYRQMEWEGRTVKGHEFHYSSIKACELPDSVEVLRIQRSAMGKEVDTPIYKYKNVIAGYTHWYWAENESLELIV